MEEKIISETQTNLQIAKGRKETRENKVRDIGDKKFFFKKWDFNKNRKRNESIRKEY